MESESQVQKPLLGKRNSESPTREMEICKTRERSSTWDSTKSSPRKNRARGSATGSLTQNSNTHVNKSTSHSYENIAAADKDTEGSVVENTKMEK